MATPFDWTNLATNTIAPIGGKILGEALAPDPSLISAQSNQQNSAAQTALNQAAFTQKQKGAALALPGMLKTLGYTAPDAAAAEKSFGYQPNIPGTSFTGSSTPQLPSLGNTSAPGSAPGSLAKTIAGAGLSVAPSLIGALGGGAAAANASIAAGGAPLAASGGLGAIGSTLGALATNPFTIAGAGALAAGLLWKKSQAHPTADKWVQGEQNPFDKTMSNVDQQMKQGALTPDEAKQLKAANAQQYLSDLQEFSTKGGHENLVARQAAQTFRQYYGDPAQYGVQISI